MLFIIWCQNERNPEQVQQLKNLQNKTYYEKFDSSFTNTGLKVNVHKF